MACKLTKIRPNGATISRTAPYDIDPNPMLGHLQKKIIISEELKITKRCKTKVSEEDMKCISCVVYHETASEPYEGKLAMTNMILNRFYDNYDGIFEYTIKDIIFQEGQFIASVPSFADSWNSTVKLYEQG